MEVKYSESSEKIAPAKKTIKVTDVYLKNLKFVNEENGDVTEQIISGLPEGTEKVSFNITIELPSKSDGRDGGDE